MKAPTAIEAQTIGSRLEPSCAGRHESSTEAKGCAAVILYGSEESGHCYKIALALRLLQLRFEFRPVDIFSPRDERPGDFREASRFGEVPVLLLQDGTSISQSNAILLHLARTSGRLDGGASEDLLTQWLFWEANRIGFSVPNLRYAKRHLPQTPQQVIAWLQDRVDEDLDRLEQELSDSRPFLLGEEISIADIACCAYLYWPEEAGLELAAWPGLVGWLRRIAELPEWQHPYADCYARQVG